MLKKILIALGVLLTLGAILIGAGVYYFSPNANHVLRYIKNNPESSSIVYIRNGEQLLSLNENKVMPLASTVKLIVAVEYAEQAAAGLIDPDTKVALEETDRYYIAGTDGGAHPAWKKEVLADSATIRDIAYGMLKYSSNANTDWLLNRLGIEKVNQRIEELGINDHTEIYYLASSLFVPGERFDGLDGQALIDSLRALEDSVYISLIHQINQKLTTDSTYKATFKNVPLSVQKVWSDRLPASTASEYVSLMQKMNSKSYFNPDTQELLDEVVEWIMENPANQQWLKHSGQKGGSTASVLTKALYATDQDGNTTEMAYFLEDLSPVQSLRLPASMNQFELMVLTDDSFREELIRELSNL